MESWRQITSLIKNSDMHEQDKDKNYPATTLFSVPTKQAIITRFTSTLHACPKIFFASFAWEGFGFLCERSLHKSSETVDYYFMTGLGTFFGVLFAHLMTTFVLGSFINNRDMLVAEIQYGMLLAIASGLAAGTVWQFNVNTTESLNFNFTGAFFYVMAMAAFVFFIVTYILRRGNDFLPLHMRCQFESASYSTLRNDFLLGLSIGAADGFFVGTDNAEFRAAWLPGFNVSHSTSVFAAMLLSGSSGLVGYLLMQTLQNLILTSTWTDRDDALPQSDHGDEEQIADIGSRDSVNPIIENEGVNRV